MGERGVFEERGCDGSWEMSCKSTGGSQLAPQEQLAVSASADPSCVSGDLQSTYRGGRGGSIVCLVSKVRSVRERIAERGLVWMK